MKNMLNKINSILLRQEKKQLLLLGFGSIGLSLCEMLSIGIIIPILGLYVAPEKIHSFPILIYLYNLIGVKDDASFLTALIVSAFILFILKLVYSVAILYNQQRIVGNIYNRLTSAILSSYLERPYAFHLMNNSAVLFKNVYSEASNFVYYLVNPLIFMGSEILILVCICALLISVYPVIMLFLLTTSAIALLSVNLLFKRRVKSYGIQREVFSEQMYKTSLEALSAVKEIQVYNVQQFFVAKYREAVGRYTNGFMKFTVISGLPRYIFEIILFTFVLCAILFGLYFHKSSLELIPIMIVIGIAALRLLPSFSKIYTNVNYLHYGINSLDIILKILHDDTSIDMSRKADNPVAGSVEKPPSIDLKNIMFSYKTASSPIFKDFNISIPLNNIVAIVGETGSGKSTLIDIIMGLLEPSDGSVHYCGSSLSRSNAPEYKRKIGYVPQNISLIDDTIVANIAFGVSHEKIDYKRVEYVIKLAQLETFVNGLQESIYSKVGERGVRISGGQRQRMGVARALYRNPQILILDEATSALDSRTEADLYGALKKIGNGLTVILVTHRLTTLEHADLIYVMGHGKIVDRGSYEELSNRSHIFHRIATEQNADREDR